MTREPPETRQWVDDGREPEVELPRGDVTDGVVRVGQTVRRPHHDRSIEIAHYLDHLEAAGFAGSPRFLGRDVDGRDVLTYLPGDVAGASPEPWAASESLLVSVADLVLDLHRAAAGFDESQIVFPPRPGTSGKGTVVTHLDVTPQNVTVRDGRAVGLIDFDLCRRVTAFDEIANTAMHWVPLRDPTDTYPLWGDVDQPRRLRILADAFALSRSDRARFVPYEIDHAEQSWHRMRERADREGGGWARMWADGVGDQIRRRQEWLIEAGDSLTEALLTERT